MRQKKKLRRVKRRNRVGPPASPPADCLPKVCGADVELGNFVLGMTGGYGTGKTASRMLLAEITGIPQSPPAASKPDTSSLCTSYTTGVDSAYDFSGDNGQHQKSTAITSNPQDWGRKFLASNGGCVYIDLDHLELCLPEVRSAYDFVAAWHAMLLITRQSLEAANQNLPEGRQIQVLVNNTDGQGNSYGGHLNFLIARRTWENVLHRKLQYLGYLASFQASSLIISGQGKVGAENYAPPVPYQIAQRADFLETICGVQTTYRRPLVNSRDEPLCGLYHSNRSEQNLDAKYARLHCICYDTNLCQVACLLKVGMMQIVLAMLEADRISPRLILDDPVDAAVRFSHDPALQTRVSTADGRQVTATELQLRFLDRAMEFVDRGGCDPVVLHAEKILALYADTLQKLRAGDLEALASRLDWVLKLHILRRVMAQRHDLSWQSPEIKHLDHIYSSLDIDGLFWTYQRAGAVEQVVSDAEIERFVHQPPEDTRAWTRAMLLRAAPERIEFIDWDEIRFRSADQSCRSADREVHMADPLGLTKAQAAKLFQPGQTLEAILDALGATEPPNRSKRSSFIGGAYHEVPSTS